MDWLFMKKKEPKVIPRYRIVEKKDSGGELYYVPQKFDKEDDRFYTVIGADESTLCRNVNQAENRIEKYKKEREYSEHFVVVKEIP